MARQQPERIDDRWQVSPRTADVSRSRPGPHVGPIRLTPTVVVFLIALVGSLGYLAFALTVRDPSQIPMLASGAAVLGIVFIALAAAGAVRTYQAGVDGHGGRAFGLAVGGGIAAVIGFVCFAAAIVLALVWQR
jgi:hypothetical protein